ncbi:SDR family NAD(P)-dependent oxidoreductase [Caproicibacter sp.]|uniref:SDR family NAD(P)-dependent oxidoreductase n=1 Tax=Caproicibacter sp. TaxID=2814884 RepID=UPI003988EABA
MKKAIIIGATSGMGRETAKLLSAKGYAVGIAGRRMERLEALQKELSSKSFLKQIDVSSPDSAVSLFQQMICEMDGADIIVICAGIVRPNLEADWEKDRDTIQTDVVGFAAIADAAVSCFRSQGHGHLVGISSLSALVYSDRTNAYCASKAFVSSYLKGLRQLFRKSKGEYHVTEVLPGWVKTEMTQHADLSKVFWATTAEKAAEQIYDAIEKHKKKIYISKRWRLIGILLSVLPERYKIK